MSQDFPLRLLVVAPDEAARGLLRTALEDAHPGGVVIEEAVSLEDAASAVVRLRPDAVVVAAPGLDGHSPSWTVRALLRLASGVPLLVAPMDGPTPDLPGDEALRSLVEALRRAWAVPAGPDGDDNLGVLAHDLLTPASAIVGLSDLALRYWDRFGEGERRQTVASIGALGRELAALVERLVKTAAASGEAPVGELRPTHVGPLVRDAVAGIRPLARRHRFSVSVEEGLPPVLSDPAALLDAVRNFLSNAVKYSPPGSTVTVGVGRTEGEVRVGVTDQGPGIDPGHHDLLFRKFSRLPGERRPGHGLGLYLARRIAEAHGGRVWVESAPGKGATFVLAIPLDPGPPPPRDRRLRGRPRRVSVIR